MKQLTFNSEKEMLKHAELYGENWEFVSHGWSVGNEGVKYWIEVDNFFLGKVVKMSQILKGFKIEKSYSEIYNFLAYVDDNDLDESLKLMKKTLKFIKG